MTEAKSNSAAAVAQYNSMVEIHKKVIAEGIPARIKQHQDIIDQRNLNIQEEKARLISTQAALNDLLKNPVTLHE